ncbi:MAG: hypothetical protein M3011_03170 [Actinomycetota bacterium]|nr:hypothetical protein [Actinomycetota bacterium]
MTAASVSPGRHQAGNALLVAGYAVAAWALARAVPMYRERRRRRFLAAQAGTAAVAAGWALRGEPVRSALNAAMVAVLAAAWWISGLRRTT